MRKESVEKSQAQKIQIRPRGRSAQLRRLRRRSEKEMAGAGMLPNPKGVRALGIGEMLRGAAIEIVAAMTEGAVTTEDDVKKQGRVVGTTVSDVTIRAVEKLAETIEEAIAAEVIQLLAVAPKIGRGPEAQRQSPRPGTGVVTGVETKSLGSRSGALRRRTEASHLRRGTEACEDRSVHISKQVDLIFRHDVIARSLVCAGANVLC